jgi:hypothetical protein
LEGGDEREDHGQSQVLLSEDAKLLHELVALEGGKFACFGVESDVGKNVWVGGRVGDGEAD